jgi:hypothetical protein
VKALERSESGDSTPRMTEHSLELRSDVRCAKLQELEPALQKWVEIQAAFDDANEEGPFSYTERPQIGFLAAAIWQSNGIALEEWKSEKAGTASDEASSDYSGRCDLWFTTNRKSPGKHGGWYLEAKHLWMRAGRVADRLRDPELSGMDQAVAAAQRHREKRHRLGCVFISVVVDRKRAEEPDEYPKLLDTLPKATSHADALAWYITPRKRLKSRWVQASSQPDLAVATILVIARCKS